MPVKGLSDQIRLPRLGKIRLGVKVSGAMSSYPKQVDYFVCPEAVRNVYGERPGELRILFPNEDEGKWASQFYRCYSRQRGLVCKGDGERASALVDENTDCLATANSISACLKEIDCDLPTCPYYGKQCRRVMNLQFLLPDVPGLGVWQIDTSSYWSITNVNSAVRLVRQLCGRVGMIPLTLKLQPHEVQPEGEKKTVYVLNLDTQCTLVDMLAYARSPVPESGMAESGVVLPAPDVEPPDDLFPPEVLDGSQSGGEGL